MRRKWFLFFFRRSVSQRKGRVAIASAAVTLAVAVVTAMIGVTFGIREKLGTELKSYGANIIVSSDKGEGFDPSLTDRIRSIAEVEDVTGQVLGTVIINRQQLEVIGMDRGRAKEMGWRLTGRWPEKENEVIAGISLKAALNLKEGTAVSVSKDSNTREFIVSGFIEKGGTEDMAVIMSLKQAWSMYSGEGRLHTLLVRGSTGMIEQAAAKIRELLPDAEIKTVRQVAMAEEALLGKIQMLMLLVTIVVLTATSISVASTMGANVLERREEIGLMKALGASRSGISIFYLAESVLVGLSGGAAGLLVGAAAAQAVSKGAFNSYIGMPVYLPFISMIMGIAVALVSSWFPVQNAMKYDPAVILRGE
jgi:putative ABC transport system permease protein